MVCLCRDIISPILRSFAILDLLLHYWPCWPISTAKSSISARLKDILWRNFEQVYIITYSPRCQCCLLTMTYLSDFWTNWYVWPFLMEFHTSLHYYVVLATPVLFAPPWCTKIKGRICKQSNPGKKAFCIYSCEELSTIFLSFIYILVDNGEDQITVLYSVLV